MLNGRVYGGNRTEGNGSGSSSSANVFANAKDVPEFVEWGHSSMGSSVEGSHRSNGLGEEEDVSGMAWVRRRREEREKKAREDKEKAEREKRESAGKTAEVQLPPPPGEVANSANEEHHVLRAVTVPVHNRPHHSRANSSSSLSGFVGGSGPRPPSRLSTEVGGRLIDQEAGDIDIKADGSSEEDEDEDEDGDEESGEGGEDGSEEDEVSGGIDDDSPRKTAASAGVEKISRWH